MKLYIVGASFATSLFLSPLFCLSYGSYMVFISFLIIFVIEEPLIFFVGAILVMIFESNVI